MPSESANASDNDEFVTFSTQSFEDAANVENKSTENDKIDESFEEIEFDAGNIVLPSDVIDIKVEREEPQVKMRKKENQIQEFSGRTSSITIHTNTMFMY